MFDNYFYYDETSPSFLRWKVSIPRSSRKAGDVAGCLTKDGYWKVGLNGKNYSVHRVVYILFYKELPDNMDIDHVDRNKSNNSINNLRMVTEHQNSTNSSVSVNNTTGVRGVKYREYKYSKAYICSWKDLNGVQRSKSFTIGKYSKEEAFRLACEYRKKIIEELNRAGLCYNE